MRTLYITADQIGNGTGGGTVTWHESQALSSVSDCAVWGRDQSTPRPPFEQDQYFMRRVHHCDPVKVRLAQCYAGCLSQTVETLRSFGVKTVYTCAAHDKDESREEYQKLGVPFNYPHLTDPGLWREYVRGYLEADVLVVPSDYSKRVMEKYGRTRRIEVIPHGVEIPPQTKPIPKTFTVGYLGAVGPDKGLLYLIQAWKKLNYKDAVLKIGGRQSADQFVRDLINIHGGGNVQLLGWVKNVSDFYNGISVYVQPSVTEGYGIEVLEAMAHDRPVICTTTAGAADAVPVLGGLCLPRDPDSIAYQIEAFRSGEDWVEESKHLWREAAKKHTWDKVRAKYVALWRGLTNG